MKTLHLLRKRNDSLALEAIGAELAAGGRENVTVLLIQDAVLEVPDLPVPIFVNGEDLKARGVERPGETVGYGRISRLVLEHDRAVVW